MAGGDHDIHKYDLPIAICGNAVSGIPACSHSEKGMRNLEIALGWHDS